MSCGVASAGSWTARLTDVASAENSKPNSKRVPGRPFKPGQSGNPGGRPKGLAAAVREMAPAEDLVRWYQAIWARDEVQLAILGVNLEQVTLAERNKAGEWLTERGYGKAPTHAPIEGENPLELDSVARRIATVLDELAERREAVATREAPPTELAGTG